MSDLSVRPVDPALRLILPLLLLAGCAGSGTFGGRGGGGAGDDDDDDPSGARALDLSQVVAAPVLQPYSAGLRVTGWGGEATWTITDGAMPPGLELTDSGVIQGTPSWLGSWTITVLAADLPFADSGGDVTIEVVPGDLPLGLGWDHDQLNNMQDINGGPLMGDPWLRVAGGGEDTMSQWTMDPGLYAPGADGVLRRGSGDDVRVGDVAPSELSVSVGPWDPASSQWDTNDPITHDGGLTFTAHEDCGELPVTIVHATWGTATTRVISVPPDWCPLGEHAGGAWAPGQCE